MKCERVKVKNETKRYETRFKGKVEEKEREKKKVLIEKIHKSSMKSGHENVAVKKDGDNEQSSIEINTEEMRSDMISKINKLGSTSKV